MSKPERTVSGPLHPLPNKQAKRKIIERKEIGESYRNKLLYTFNTVWGKPIQSSQLEDEGEENDGDDHPPHHRSQEYERNPKDNEEYDYGTSSLSSDCLMDSLMESDVEVRGRRLFGDKLEEVVSLLFDYDYSTYFKYPGLFRYFVWRLVSFFDHPLALPYARARKFQGSESTRDVPELKSFFSIIDSIPLEYLEELFKLCNERSSELSEIEEESKTIETSSDQPTIQPNVSISSISDYESDSRLGGVQRRLTRVLGIKKLEKDTPSNSKEIQEDVEHDYPELSWSKVVLQDEEKKARLIEPSIAGYKYELGNNYSEEGWEKICKDFKIEEMRSDESYYIKHFVGKEHLNFIAIDGQSSTFILSLDVSSKQPRALLRTVKKDVKLLLPSGIRAKEFLKAIKVSHADLIPSTLKFIPVKDSELEKELMSMEQKERGLNVNYKFGILLCKDGQIEENDMFCNHESTPELDEFLDFIGSRVKLEGWQKYRGGLDVKNNSTGTESIFTNLHNYEIMFHVSTLLPYFPADPQQLERKRHLGNDVVVIIFKQGSQRFQPDQIRSEFNHVFFVIQKENVVDGNSPGTTRYSIEVVCKEIVPRPFRPLLSSPSVFPKDESLRQFLLTKFVNAERTALHSPHFELKFHRTRQMLLRNLAQQFLKKKDLEGV